MNAYGHGYGNAGSVRSKVKRAILSAVLMLCFFRMLAVTVFAQETVEQVWTWNSGLEGWSEGSSGVALSNPGGYMQVGFDEQPYPIMVATVAKVDVTNSMMVTNISFRFRANDVPPSAARLYIYAGGNAWRLNLEGIVAGEWLIFDAPVEYAAGWTLGEQSSEIRFLADIRKIDSVGLYIRRHASCSIQTYLVDDFSVQGELMPQPPAPMPDCDGDGLPDYWELLSGLSTNDATDAALDSDGDGMSNFAEYRAGTDPRSAGSYLSLNMAISNVPDATVGIVLSWYSVTNRSYTLWRSTNLVDGLRGLDWNIPATPPVNRYLDGTATGIGPYFYKIQVEE